MKYYNFETMFRTLKEQLAAYLKKNNIYYECSGCFGSYHFEIKATPEQAEQINNYLDTITIWCKGVTA